MLTEVTERGKSLPSTQQLSSPGAGGSGEGRGNGRSLFLTQTVDKHTDSWAPGGTTRIQAVLTGRTSTGLSLVTGRHGTQTQGVLQRGEMNTGSKDIPLSVLLARNPPGLGAGGQAAPGPPGAMALLS